VLTHWAKQWRLYEAKGGSGELAQNRGGGTESRSLTPFAKKRERVRDDRKFEGEKKRPRF